MLICPIFEVMFSRCGLESCGDELAQAVDLTWRQGVDGGRYRCKSIRPREMRA